MALILIFILCLVIGGAIVLSLHLLAYYLIYHKGEGVRHMINTLEAMWDLYKRKVNKQVEINKRPEVLAIVEDVEAEDVPPCWAVTTSSNYTDYVTTEIAQF